MVPFIDSFSDAVVLQVNGSSSQGNFEYHPLFPVFRQFFDERKHAEHFGTFGNGYRFNQSCRISNQLQKEIAGYNETVHKIMETVLNGSLQGKSYTQLSLFVDLFPNRIVGSYGVENAITFLEDKMAGAGLTNLHEEASKTVIWSRGIEMASLTNPIEMPLNVHGLSLTVETPEEGIEARIIVVSSFRDLEIYENEVEGQIVVFNSKSGDAHMHILFGAIAAAKYGALAVLCRSPTKLIYNSAVLYETSVPKIPAAVITCDDADKLERMESSEDDVFVFLKIIHQAEYESISTNVIGDYHSLDPVLGKEKLMLVSHVGTLDVGEGAQDDALGIIMALQVIKLFRLLNLHPKRTIQLGIFTGERTGLFGATQWAGDHQNELNHYTAAMEADMGCFSAAGFLISGSKDTACVMQEIMGLLKNETNATLLLSKMEAIPSIMLPIHATGVPLIGLIGDNNRSAYWETRNSFLDSMTNLESNEMDKCLAIMASVAYVLADMSEMLPRRG